MPPLRMRDGFEKWWQPFSVLVVAPLDADVRALEQALEAGGYAVIRAEGGDEAVEVACVARPDAVLLGGDDAYQPGIEVCRRLNGDPRFPATTPVILLVATELPGEIEAAYRMGVWDVYAAPHDAPELLLKLRTFMRARLVSERLHAGSLVDAETGVYSSAGLTMRTREVAAAASRAGDAVSCVALCFTPADASEAGDRDDDGGGEGAFLPAIVRAAAACRRLTRASDVLARLGESEFGLIAPGADAAGAAVLVTRMRRYFDRRAGVVVRLAARSVPAFVQDGPSLLALLADAREALREATPPRPAASAGAAPAWASAPWPSRAR